MNFIPTLFTLLLSISLIMCVAMTLSWLHLGRQRYILTWAVGYGVGVLHWSVNLVVFFFFADKGTALALAALPPVITASLGAIGCRQRSGLPNQFGRFVIAGGLVALTILALVPSGVHAGMRLSLPCSYALVMMIVAQHAILRAPQRRDRLELKEGLRSPEIALIGSFGAFGAFQSALAVTGLLVVGSNGDIRSAPLLQPILGIALPSAHIAMAASIMFLVASDLAEKFRKLVTRDPLTGILNRRGVEESAAMAVANCQRHGRALSLVLADIDGFKALNDRLGHMAGDRALVAFTEYVQAAIRHGDVFGRLGGDEFCLILLDTSPSTAVQVIERARADIERLSRSELPQCQLTASFGVTGLRPGDRFLDTLIGRADKALYQSKTSGRNCISLARGDEPGDEGVRYKEAV